MNSTANFHKLSNQFRHSYEYIIARLPSILISLGIILRVKRWLENRSLWLDEAYLGIHLMAKSWKGILLNHRWSTDFPVPPMGFMLMEKINTTIFGNNELALRLFPLCCGIASIFLFYALAKKLLSYRFMILVLTFFVFNDVLIDYSAELKQYSTDLFIFLSLSLMFLVKADEKFAIHKKDVLLFAGVGMVAITFSHTAIFVLAAFGIFQQWMLLRGGHTEEAKTGVKVGFWWLLIFGIWYNISLSHMASEPQLIKAVKNPGYMINVPLWSWGAIRWYGDKIYDIISNVAGLKPFILAAPLFAIGLLSLFRDNKRAVYILCFTLVMTFVAAGFGRYLLGGRFSLFMIPVFLIVTVKGLQKCCNAEGWRSRLIFLLSAVIFIAGLFPPTWKHFWHGQQKEESRELIRYFQTNVQAGDILMINEAATMAFWYYSGQNGIFQLPEYILTSDKIIQDDGEAHIYSARAALQYDDNGYFYGTGEDWIVNKIHLNSPFGFKNIKRIWFLASHAKGSENFIKKYFRRQGFKTLEYQKAPGALLMLVELP